MLYNFNFHCHCLQHTWDATNPTQTFGTHTTPIARYVDDFDFTFEEQNDGSCFIKVSTYT